MADDMNTTRRGFSKGALGALGGFAALMATGAAVEAADALIADSTDEQLLHHVREIVRLVNEGAPEGAIFRGFQFHGIEDGLIEESIWATVMMPDYSLAHTRPAVYTGWRRNGEGV